MERSICKKKSIFTYECQLRDCMVWHQGICKTQISGSIILSIDVPLKKGYRCSTWTIRHARNWKSFSSYRYLMELEIRGILRSYHLWWRHCSLHPRRSYIAALQSLESAVFFFFLKHNMLELNSILWLVWVARGCKVVGEESFSYS